MDAIREDVVRALAGAGFDDVRVRLTLSPAWTTDWISAAGRSALQDYGIAPPSATGPVRLRMSVKCPHCGSLDTREVAHFGSTSCKALFVCSECGEPFDHFKAL
jgi:ring-1,2-phenylacetyl-CoA epoxidase subunit PaaD